MAGSLDEFFDFAKLEADMERGMQQRDNLRERDSPMEMQWEPSTTDASCPLAAWQSQCTEAVLPAYEPGVPLDFVLSGIDGMQWAGDEAGLFNGPVSFQAYPGAVPSSDDNFATNPVNPPVNPLPHHDLDGVGPVGAASPLTTPQLVPEQPIRQRPSLREPASAKHKGRSTRIPLATRQLLEDEFTTNPYPCSWEIDIIAHQVGLDAKRVRNWFNNARARRKPEAVLEKTVSSTRTLASKLSAESLERLANQEDGGVAAPQPPLATYLASSYLEEAARLSDIQAAAAVPSSERGGFTLDSSSVSRVGRSGSVITSVTSSEGSAPTSFTMSSRGSNTSSFGRDRRRGRRRMTWRNSPYNRPNIDGLDDAGKPSRNLPFFCTFCPRAFKTKYEWIRHEDSVHALRTTYICCGDKMAVDSLAICPFCGEKRPDEVHMAGHKYQQCRNKPEMHRTFYRRDHFVQHLHHVHFADLKHPSVRAGCGSRSQTAQRQEFGCKELTLKWRRFGAPMRPNDPMLHCGFCGVTLRDWTARCDHIAEHLAAGGWSRAAWWPGRKETHMENLCQPHSTGPFRCRYCSKVFANADAMHNHSHCRVWSCRFLRTSDDVAADNSTPPLCPQLPSPKAHHCHLCGAGYRAEHIEHALQYHKYRLCDQEVYSSKEDFLQHLHESHGASNPLLLMQNHVLEQQYSRNKGPSFEPVDFNELLQGCRVATPEDSFVDPFTEIIPTGPPASPERGAGRTQQLNRPGSRKAHDHPWERLPPSTETQQSLRQPANPEIEPPGPRMFRLDPLVPFLSSRIYFVRKAKKSELFGDGKALLNEFEHAHIASLVMSSGLLGMAAVRLPVKMKRDESRGMAELRLED
ncbi:hypothetical protein M011DRAFT_468386 [Sporormia fimetaria CBS 119925]|uniref:Homeobox domain-containing protein n=1 Tax=Sporormia fimetaria CBS 119925 TaxID=1340428 RepID=A0A6A6V837_9PLEO|nr:hypothetical protein M011DRAFT_468386 [Sporormia fimetaria CBS 119925]